MPDIVEIALVAVPAVLAVTVHEVAHGWMAMLCGDPTAARAGRLSLNPLRHVDPIGSVVLPLMLKVMGAPFLFGWARPVPVNWQRLRHLRLGLALVAGAGPFSNLLMLMGWALLLKGSGDTPWLARMCWTGVAFNATIFALNLLPLPPLDGSRLVTALLPSKLGALYNRLEPYGLALTALLLVTGGLGAFMRPVLRGVEHLVQTLLG